MRGVQCTCVIQNSSTFRRQQVLYIFPKNCVKIRFSVLEYTETEKDLGILMNRTLNFTDHSNFLYGRANKGFGLFKRTYPFVHSIEKRRVLYFTMVRSLFEHCPIIWRPSSDTAVNRLESLQMRAIKWI